MDENVFTPLTAVPKSIEVCSLVEQMEKQYITHMVKLVNTVHGLVTFM